MSPSVPQVLEVLESEAPAVPVVFDSPHSGELYPPDFNHAAPFFSMIRSVDRLVDDLYAAAPKHGAVLLRALFPRAYIDANRSLEDLDAGLLAEPWPGELRPSAKVDIGLGLICKYTEPNVLIYDRRLSVAEVQSRIENYYMPYHRTLAGLLNERHARFGQVWHVDCHSMLPVASDLATDRGSARPDMVLGDQDGTTCSLEFRSLVHDLLAGMGYEVKDNNPFKGVELVRANSDPNKGRHSLQIEVNQKLYLNPETYEPGEGYQKLKASLTRLIKGICEYAAARTGAGK